MKIDLYQVDAFATRPFTGNPAAVCPLDQWLEDALLQHIATENNLSETAFFVPGQDAFHLRWFTPVQEVDLCGHATLASAHVIYRHLGHAGAEIVFHTRSGPLLVRRSASGLTMDFPVTVPRPVSAPPALLAGLGSPAQQVFDAGDYIVVLEHEAQVRTLAPDFTAWRQLDRRGVVVTAPGDEVDFVSRAFFPKLGVDEDPVTGSAHCELMPYWSERLGRTTLRARQISSRGGELLCELRGDRVLLTGQAVDYLHGQIRLGEE